MELHLSFAAGIKCCDRGRLGFSKIQQQLLNSSGNNGIIIIFHSLKSFVTLTPIYYKGIPTDFTVHVAARNKNDLFKPKRRSEKKENYTVIPSLGALWLFPYGKWLEKNILASGKNGLAEIRELVRTLIASHFLRGNCHIKNTCTWTLNKFRFFVYLALIWASGSVSN